MEPEDLTVIGHTGDLLVDIYARNLTHIYISPPVSYTHLLIQCRRRRAELTTAKTRFFILHKFRLFSCQCLKAVWRQDIENHFVCNGFFHFAANVIDVYKRQRLYCLRDHPARGRHRGLTA